MRELGVFPVYNNSGSHSIKGTTYCIRLQLENDKFNLLFMDTKDPTVRRTTDEILTIDRISIIRLISSIKHKHDNVIYVGYSTIRGSKINLVELKNNSLIFHLKKEYVINEIELQLFFDVLMTISTLQDNIQLETYKESNDPFSNIALFNQNTENYSQPQPQPQPDAPKGLQSLDGFKVCNVKEQSVPTPVTDSIIPKVPNFKI